VLWLAPERTEPGQAADIGQATPVAPFAPEVVGDTPAVTVPESPAGRAKLPEPTSGAGIDDRTIDDQALGDRVDLAYAVDDDAPPPTAAAHTAPPSADDGTLPEGSVRADETPGAGDRPGWVETARTGSAGDAAEPDLPAVTAATDTDIDAGEVPSATDADGPHFPDDAPDDAVAHHAELLDTAPSAGVSADAPVVAPEVPEVDVAPPGTAPGSQESDQVPPDAAAEDEPPAMELTPGAAEAVLDEPRGDSDVTETTVAVGGTGSAAIPSATAPAGPDGDTDSDTDGGTAQGGAST